jgi:tetratricopeptide (TPR) repeat protein
MLKINSILKSKSCLFIMLLLVILFLSIFYKHKIYNSLGNLMFGSKIGNYTIYNLELADFFLTLAADKKQPDIWTNYQLSRINFIQGNYNEAIIFANTELKFYPENCRTYYIRGLTNAYGQDLDSAIKDFEKFNTCFPDSWAGHNDLAWLWFRKGDNKKVIETVELALNKNTNSLSPWLQNTYGVALMNSGRYFEAENALLMAKYLADNMQEKDWGKSYPGNDPQIYGAGLESMRNTINNNILILNKKTKTLSN